jgi:hypothetical protein
MRPWKTSRSANGLIRYEWPAFGGSWSVMAWAYYQSETFYDILNHPVSREDGYTVVNFRTAFVPHSYQRTKTWNFTPS